MKAGWTAKPLEDLASFRSGLWTGKKGPFTTAKVLRNTNIRKHGILSLDDVAEIEVETKQLASRRLQSGDIVLERSGGGPKQPVGRAVCFELNEKNYSFSNFTSVIRVQDPARISYRFLHLALNWWYETGVTEGIQSNSTGIRNLDFNAYKALEVPLPPLEEQRQIVAVLLDEAFEGLARARAHAEANLSDAKELFDNSLVGIFDDLEATAQKLTLAEASTLFGRGKSRHRPRNAPFLYGGNYPFVQTGDIRNSSGTLTSYSQTYSEHGLAQSRLWPTGTVCITIAANIAETAVLGFDACFPDSIIGMVADPNVTFPEYVEFMLRYFAAELKALGKGSAQDNINLATFETTTFPFPDIDRQVEVFEKLSALTKTTTELSDAYRTKLQELDDLRRSLLQKAFAGELT